MTFDPTKPINGVLIDADFLRGQLNGLKALIDAGILTGVVVDGVNTVAPSNPANATASIIGGVLHLTFDIPQGNDGPQGMPGQSGADGQQGPPGEVSTAQLDSAIAGTSNNSNTVQMLGITISDPPTQAEVATIASKVDELIGALHR